MPYYRHDCMNPKCCRYVGSSAHNELPAFDVYVYTGIGGMVSLNIRLGDDGPEYQTSPVEVYRQIVRENRSPASYVIERALQVYDRFCISAVK